jgi:hypothetical protein
MAIVDERGRLFGRWNLLDFAILILIIGLIPLGYAAYVLFREQLPRIVSIAPVQVQQPSEFQLVLKGENLRPYMRVSAGVYQARDFHFKSTEEADVSFAVTIPPGQYDIILYDQAQERFRLPNALTVLPSALPVTQIVAIGAFGNLDAAGAAKLTAGTALPGAGEVVAVGKPSPDLTQVFSGSALVGVPIPNALRLPAVVLFSCYVRAQQGRPFCVVEDATVAPSTLLMLSTPLGKTPFQVERVRSPHPLEAIAVLIRFAGTPSLLSKIKVGDIDRGSIASDLGELARVDSVGPVRASGEVDVRIIAQLQRVDHRWLYDSGVLRAGSTLTLKTPDYEVAGIVVDMPLADSKPRP